MLKVKQRYLIYKNVFFAHIRYSKLKSKTKIYFQIRQVMISLVQLKRFDQNLKHGQRWPNIYKEWKKDLCRNNEKRM